MNRKDNEDRCRQTGERQHIQEHLANERTFLSWIRTSVAVLAFGFVIEKFSAYLRFLEYQGSMFSTPTRGVEEYRGLSLNLLTYCLLLTSC